MCEATLGTFQSIFMDEDEFPELMLHFMVTGGGKLWTPKEGSKYMDTKRKMRCKVEIRIRNGNSRVFLEG